MEMHFQEGKVILSMGVVRAVELMETTQIYAWDPERIADIDSIIIYYICS